MEYQLPVGDAFPQRQHSILQQLQTILSYERLTSSFYLAVGKESAGSSDSDLYSVAIKGFEEDTTHCELVRNFIGRYSANLGIETPSDSPDTVPSTQYTLAEKLNLLRETETLLVEAYNKLCAFTIEYDYRMFDLAYRNGFENSFHVDLLSRFVAEPMS
ncbi:MAG: hypothetical protein AAF402_09945 [Pseudomonadota bacterium]